jgi:hypothetical protein
MATVTAQTAAEREAQHMKEREAQKKYWSEHSTEPTVEAMMLDSKASEIDRLERPEVKKATCSNNIAARLNKLWLHPSRCSHALVGVENSSCKQTYDHTDDAVLCALTQLYIISYSSQWCVLGHMLRCPLVICCAWFNT